MPNRRTVLWMGGLVAVAATGVTALRIASDSADVTGSGDAEGQPSPR